MNDRNAIPANSPILNSHNRAWADPTFQQVARDDALRRAGLSPELVETVHEHIARHTAVSARQIAKRHGFARLKVEAAIETLLRAGVVRATAGVLHA